MHADLEGFSQAPISMVLMYVFGASTALNLSSTYRGIFGLSKLRLGRFQEYYRIGTQHLAFENAFKASIGLYLLYRFRFVERWFGSRKYASFVVFVLTISSALQVLMVSSLSVQHLANGPYALIAALALAYHYYVPQTNPRLIQIWRLCLSNKTGVYLLLFMLCGSKRSDFLPAFSGFVPALLFLSSHLPFRHFRLPNAVVNLFSWIRPLLEHDRQDAQRRRIAQLQRMAAHGGMPRQENNPQAQGFRDQLLPGGGMFPGNAFRNGVAAVSQPSEEAINQLTALGFERERVIAALRNANNNVEAAANQLLST